VLIILILILGGFLNSGSLKENALIFILTFLLLDRYLNKGFVSTIQRTRGLIKSKSYILNFSILTMHVASDIR